MKLELKYLSPYQEHKVKLYDQSRNKYNIAYLSTKKIAFIDVNGYGEVQKMSWSNASGKIKPILRPMSDFYKSIEGVSFSNMISHGYHNEFWYAENFNVNQLMYRDLQLLLSKHADVFGLIEKKLAIDINTIKS